MYHASMRTLMDNDIQRQFKLTRPIEPDRKKILPSLHLAVCCTNCPCKRTTTGTHIGYPLQAIKTVLYASKMVSVESHHHL